jgi:nucleoside-diphosphate-sugar epimerase
VPSVLVTGASGKLGRAVIAELLQAGYEVSATDLKAPADNIGANVVAADLLDYGQTIELLHGNQAVVHLAGIPGTAYVTPATVFERNTRMATNVLFAAALLEMSRVVWASSETVLGAPLAGPPRYAPLDEDHAPYPTHPYGLSKVITEVAAEHISRWSGLTVVGLRFSNVFRPDEYPQFSDWWDDPTLRQWNLWSYVDARDAAAATRLAVETPLSGSVNLNIAAADTVMRTPTLELLTEAFPNTPVRDKLEGFQSLLSSARAADVIGYRPQHSWRQV